MRLASAKIPFGLPGPVSDFIVEILSPHTTPSTPFSFFLFSRAGEPSMVLPWFFPPFKVLSVSLAVVGCVVFCVSFDYPIYYLFFSPWKMSMGALK